jgi:uncharacterized protein (DUF2344 family)
MLEAGKSYKHVNGKDAAIYVALMTKESPESISCVVHWVNVTAAKNWIMASEEITIKKSDLHNWKEHEVCFR